MTDPASIEPGVSPRPFWTNEHRSRQAELLQTVSMLEHRGDELAKEILENSQRHAEA